MPGPGSVSVIIRARDEAAELGGCLDALSAQAGIGALQLIYVDAGSRDDSVELARRRGATVVSIDAFSFGAALNLGAERAEHEVLVALSAHAGLPDDGWLARACATLADPRAGLHERRYLGPRRRGR